ncbi:hypothetical protein Hypma_013107 [Hypsizygus marmoreus]|uniref:Crinkler (CRN) family protein n=1 Tax=Hypsizygus marmoreus TaxID=39966 RepID=A0A369JK08_HYPMA|nr:hypothetical protein Hypma_013107 [Hypsizygus marmoreus]
MYWIMRAGQRTSVRSEMKPLHRSHTHLKPPTLTTMSPKAQGSSEDPNWPDKANWKVAPEECQEFLRHFRNPTTAVAAEPPVFPYTLPFPSSLDPLGVLRDSGDKLLVRESYHRLFKRVCGLRESFPTSGVVVTGQPGIGKTTWLYYILVQLLRELEVVILATRGLIIVFYHDGVYHLVNTSVSWLDLPRPSGLLRRPIWCLIDPDKEVKEPPAALTAPSIFPVEAASLNAGRYSAWMKQREGRMWALPLWSHEELQAGLKLQSGYQMLVNAEQDAPSSTVALADEAIPPAIEEKLKSAIATYGTSAWDVYTAIFTPKPLRKSLYDAICDLTSADIISAFPSLNSTPSKLSYMIVSINPCPPMGSALDENDAFVINFKSAEIMNLVKAKHMLLQHNDARNLLSRCRTLPESSAFAGWVFETMAHTILSADSEDPSFGIDLVDLVPMVKSAGSPATNPVFVTPDSSSTSSSLTKRFPMQKRNIHDVDFKSLSQHEPYRDYYVPNTPNNPLFDSFVFEFKETAKTGVAVLWIIKSTIHTENQGSDEGYAHINAIREVALEHTKTLLKTSKKRKRGRPEPNVELKYVLVCPNPPQDVEWTWIMPKGWEEHGGKLRGDVYCQRIPV